MDRNVFILGAGFSAAAGAPVIDNFLDVAKQVFKRNGSGMGDIAKESYEAVFNYRKQKDALSAKVRIDLDDIEHLFSTLELESEYLDSTLLKTKRQLIHMIIDTLDRTIQPGSTKEFLPIDRIKAHVLKRYGLDVMPSTNTYSQFVLLTIGALSGTDYDSAFVTFNYDLIVDNILGAFNVRPDYGITGRFDPEPATAVRSVPVIKLHGSANWGDCNNSLCEGQPIFFQSKITNLLSKEGKVACPNCREGQLIPLIVPPTWNKGSLQSQMKAVWKRAAEEIKNARRIFFIGYSLRETDSYFRYLLALALEQNRDLERIYVIDKQRTPALIKRYEDMFTEHVRNRRLDLNFMQAGFESFVNDGLLAQTMQATFL